MNNIPGLRAERAAPPEPPVMTIESLYIAMQDMQQRHNQEKARYDEEKARSDEEKARYDEEKARSDEEKARSEEDIASLKKTVANLQANMTRFQPLVHNICRRSLLDMARLKILKLFPEYNNWSDLERNKSYDQIVIDIQSPHSANYGRPVSPRRE
ncbi:hypothetical protein EUX98_g6752 [Antrodiella citrinella]|uniref:Uncharacterized protein n=1 Tax=Antrodiella citrinella TaxID=2447956 RepID=A0A4S4MQ02_9APHY|nr:hypothetical protein EUX98_g6752 [Antrodiella citrinella]